MEMVSTIPWHCGTIMEMRWAVIQKPLLVLSSVAAGAAGTMLWYRSTADTPAPGKVFQPVTVGAGTPPTSLAARPGDLSTSAVPPAIHESTRKLIGDLIALAAEAKSGEPNRALIVRMKEVLQQSDESRRKFQFSLLPDGLRKEDAPLIPQMLSELREKGLS